MQRKNVGPTKIGFWLHSGVFSKFEAGAVFC